MKILVSGANGFIGSAIVRSLIAKGYAVRVLVRRGSDCRNLTHLPVEIAYGDLIDAASLTPALKNCGALFHVGALYRLWTPDTALFYEINVTGTRNIMLAALAANVERIVYTSSVATLGTATPGTVADENTPINPSVKFGHYKQSKFLAELEVLKLIRDRSLPATIVNPTAPIGPRDIKPTPTGRLIRDAALGKVPAFVDTGLNIVHVDDVAAGHIQAFETGEIGEKYILGGENMSLKAILETVAALTHRSPPKICLSPEIVLPFAYLTETWARLTNGNEPMITVAGVKLSKQLMYFSSQKACETLGYRPRQAIEAIADAVSWFQSESPGRSFQPVTRVPDQAETLRKE
ncbi:MAG: hopanoid-associated sugar epimerase [Gammaproteobacteria bacterium]